MFILSVDIDYFTSFGKILLPTGEVAELVESGTLLMCYAALKPHRGFESLPLRRAIAVRFITIYIYIYIYYERSLVCDSRDGALQ